jgi:hypothetical protein
LDADYPEKGVLIPCRNSAKAKQDLLDLGWVEAFGNAKGAIYTVRGTTEKAGEGTTESSGEDAPQDSPRSAPPKGDADQTRRKRSANGPQSGSYAENAREGCDFDGTTESNNGVPPDMEPAEAERWEHAMQYADTATLERMARERGWSDWKAMYRAMEEARAAKAGAKMNDAFEEAAESVKPQDRASRR